jgi:hypothetical protein
MTTAIGQKLEIPKGDIRQCLNKTVATTGENKDANGPWTVIITSYLLLSANVEIHPDTISHMEVHSAFNLTPHSIHAAAKHPFIFTQTRLISSTTSSQPPDS